MEDIGKIQILFTKLSEDILLENNIKSISVISEKTMITSYVFIMLDDTIISIKNEKEVIKKLNDILNLRSKKLKRIT